MKHSKFPQILKQLRSARDMTQDDLAAILNVSRSTVAGYEARNNQPDYDKLVQIAELFNVTIDYLLSGELKQFQDMTVRILSDKALEEQLIEAFQPLPYVSKLYVLDYARYHQARYCQEQNDKEQ